MAGEPAKRCEECGLPLAADQRYCLECGARAGSAGPQLHALMRRASSGVGGEGAQAQASSEEPASGSVPALDGALSPSPGLRLPSPRVSALLVLVFLGFGVLMGKVARTRVTDAPASARSALKVVLPGGGSPSTPTASTGTSSTSSEDVEASPPSEPSSEPQATPTTTAAKSKTPVATSPSSTSTEGGSGSSQKGGSGGGEGSSEPPAGTPDTKLPAIKHVFVVMLSDEPYASVFGPSSSAPYLASKLEHRGELLAGFHAVAHEELADEAALISGQGPTLETAANCPNYTDMLTSGAGEDEQALGTGCVYPSSTQTLPGQLEAKHLSWRAYVQGIDETGAQAPACAHPALGAADPTAEQASSTGAYATFRNPFVYFGAIVDSPQCAADDVGLASLEHDLAAPSRTPSFSYIVPDRCDDGNPTPCTPGAPAGVAQASGFLARVVPEITASKAYKQDGLLVITVDEAPSTGAFAESSSCCGEPLFPNDPVKTLTGAPRGGGIVGALLLSPFVKAGSTNEQQLNDFSLLRTVEDLFGLNHLGYAALPAVKSFEPEMFVSR
jgi:phosphatidylinositol-3-phosphatase